MARKKKGSEGDRDASNGETGSQSSVRENYPNLEKSTG